MLFDLRGRGRRRTVQVVYLGLAILIGVGLIGFGIGGGFGSTGLFNSIGSGGGGSASFAGAVKKDQQRVAKHPQDAAAWSALVSDLFHESSTGNNYDINTGAFTPASHGLLQQTSNAWQQYLQLNPDNPSKTLASYMVQVYGATGALDQPAKAVQAMQIQIASESQPAAAEYAQLAAFAFKAKNVRVGDLATAKAVELAPASERAQLRAQLKAIKKNPNAASQTTAQSQSGAQTFSLPSSAASQTQTAPAKRR